MAVSIITNSGSISGPSNELWNYDLTGYIGEGCFLMFEAIEW